MCCIALWIKQYFLQDKVYAIKKEDDLCKRKILRMIGKEGKDITFLQLLYALLIHLFNLILTFNLITIYYEILHLSPCMATLLFFN